MVYTPPAYTPSGSLTGTTTTTTPYAYGALAPTTSAYNIWGSTGNPYLVAGPSYTPGSGAPIVPRPVPRVVQPVDSGGDSAWTNGGSSTTPEQQAENDYNNRQSWIGRNKMVTRGAGGLLGMPLLDPAIDFAYGINPFPASEGKQTFDWYEGATDFAGNPITDKFSLDSNSGFAGKTEMQTSNKYGWGSDEHLSSLDTDLSGGYGGGKAYTGPMLNAWGSAQDPIAVQAEQAIAADNKRVADNIAAIEAANTPVTFGSVANPIDGVTYGGVDPANNYTAGTVFSESSGGESGGSGGDVGYNDYGGGYYGFEDADGTEVGWEDPGGSDGGGPSGDGSYIATAATQSLGTEGLTVFNNWRDYMHSWHPTFTTSFGRYRVTAPKIVKAIDAKDNSKELYKEIWDEYLLPIHKLITDKDDTNALVKYKVMVKELINKYLTGDK
jgi:hypothetical protein